MRNTTYGLFFILVLVAAAMACGCSNPPVIGPSPITTPPPVVREVPLGAPVFNWEIHRNLATPRVSIEASGATEIIVMGVGPVVADEWLELPGFGWFFVTGRESGNENWSEPFAFQVDPNPCGGCNIPPPAPPVPPVVPPHTEPDPCDWFVSTNGPKPVCRP